MKKRLMDTAIRLWKEYGYENVSINAICRECNVTKGSFYHHYASKEDVLFRYMEQSLAEIEIREDLYDENSCIESIYNVLICATKPLLELGPGLMKTMYEKNRQIHLYSGHNSRFLESHFFLTITELCEKGQKNGEIRDNFLAEELIRVSLAVLNGNVYDWVINGMPFDLLKEDHNDLYVILKK